VKFNNDPATWLIGQLANRTECSTAANLKQCRTIARTYYGTGLLESETVESEGDATGEREAASARPYFESLQVQGHAQDEHQRRTARPGAVPAQSSRPAAEQDPSD
jgi:hypothetical protein